MSAEELIFSYSFSFVVYILVIELAYATCGLTMIPFKHCEVPDPLRVSSCISILSNASTAGTCANAVKWIATPYPLSIPNLELDLPDPKRWVISINSTFPV